MKFLKIIWKTLLSLFSGMLTKIIGNTSKENNNKVKISKIEGTNIRKNESHAQLIIKKTKDSKIEDNKFF